MRILHVKDVLNMLNLLVHTRQGVSSVEPLHEMYEDNNQRNFIADSYDGVAIYALASVAWAVVKRKGHLRRDREFCCLLGFLALIVCSLYVHDTYDSSPKSILTIGREAKANMPKIYNMRCKWNTIASSKGQIAKMNLWNDAWFSVSNNNLVQVHLHPVCHVRKGGSLCDENLIWF